MTSDDPQSSADVCNAAADLIGTLAESLGMLTAITSERLVDNDMRDVIHEMISESTPDAQQDLRSLAAWFEVRPYSNRDAWIGSQSFSKRLESEEEE